MKAINAIRMGGVDVLPLVEGGKGVAISNGITAGHWAAGGGVGTFSAVNADSYDDQGRPIPQIYTEKTRTARHEELINYAVTGALTQASRARDIAGPKGRVHANILWEMGGAERIITEVLERGKGLINGITCGAGMPYRLSDIAAKFNVHYYPIHPEDPYPRVLALRKQMREFGLDETPIIMAGGVWWLEEWEHWIDNPELGPIAFQFGTRPLLTKESPIGDYWKQRLMTLQEGDVFLNRFSPTGFYSSAVNNNFIHELRERNEHQVAFTPEAIGEHQAEYGVGPRKRIVFLTPADLIRARQWEAEGRTEAMRTPDSTLIFVTPEKAREIVTDQVNCMGCLSSCRFSNWSQHGPDFDNGKRADPRSFCIQKTLQDIAHRGDTEDAVENNLMFSGHNAYRFASDPFYSNGFVPTVRQLFERIMTGR